MKTARRQRRTAWLTTGLLACLLQVGIACASPATPGSAGATSAEQEAAARRGQEVYARCAGCHAIETNRTGPLHCGLFGRRAGTAPGYANYSDAMRRSRIVWTEAELDSFLRNPAVKVPNTSMGYAGIKDDKERAELLAWLKKASQPGKACQTS